MSFMQVDGCLMVFLWVMMSSKCGVSIVGCLCCGSIFVVASSCCVWVL